MVEWKSQGKEVVRDGQEAVLRHGTSHIERSAI